MSLIDINTFWVSCILFLVIFSFLRKIPKQTVVTDLIYYPVKSCAGIHLATAEFGHMGIKNDRIWAIAKDSILISQSKDPRLLKLQPSFRYSPTGEISDLILSYIGYPDYVHSISSSKSSSTAFTLYGSSGEYQDEGDNVSAYLQSIFSQPYRLVKLTKGRPLSQVEKMPEIKTDCDLSFASEGQVLITSLESFSSLHSSLPNYVKPEVKIDCFRSNIILKHLPPFNEDFFNTFRIGDIIFEFIKKCDRCRETTINPVTLAFDENAEPLNTLRKHHGDGVKGYFGILVMAKCQGSVKVGDRVRVLELGRN